LKDVIAHKLPINHEITQLLQVASLTISPHIIHSSTSHHPLLHPTSSTPPPHTIRPLMLPPQDVFNLLPNLDIDAIIRAFTLQTNDMMLVVYVSSVVRLV
jgi:hypothetical protein